MNALKTRGVLPGGKIVAGFNEFRSGLLECKNFHIIVMYTKQWKSNTETQTTSLPLLSPVSKVNEGPKCEEFDLTPSFRKLVLIHPIAIKRVLLSFTIPLR